jgi:hypothetical protein
MGEIYAALGQDSTRWIEKVKNTHSNKNASDLMQQQEEEEQ